MNYTSKGARLLQRICAESRARGALVVTEVAPMEDNVNKFGRVLNEERKAQGFVSQAHLDAMYAATDHHASGATCSGVGGWVELHDGMQPLAGRCDEGRRLSAKWFAFHHDEAPA